MKSGKYILVSSILVSTGLFAQTDSTSINEIDSVFDENINTPAFTVSLDGIDDAGQDQSVSGLLQSSRDVYTRIAGYNFSAARFRIRGYGSENFTVMMNGVTLNNPEGGRAVWAYWGGLNDITRYQEVRNGINATFHTFGGVGGFSNINARASEIRKGTKVSYALANRSYSQRFMVTHSTGMMDNGVSIALSASGRYSNEGYVDGTFYRGASYFLSIEKKLNEKHSLGFVAYGAPTVQGRRSISTEEAYSLTGNNYYNSYWGYQDGKKRNSRVRNNNKPRVMLNHYFILNEKTKINTSAYYSFGKTGNTRLNWYSANDPRPDYYKNLPSYLGNPGQEAEMEALTALWQSNTPTTTQVDWDQMYFANGKNLYTQEKVNGSGSSVTGNRAKYIVENVRKDISDYGLTSTASHQLKENMVLSGGVNLSKYKSKNFKVVDDLLGADFWVDIDQFAERDFADELTAQSDINNPNNLVKVGDKFGYNYDINIDTYNGFGQIEGTSKKVDWFAGFSLTSTTFWRTGYMQNGLFSENSLGDSKKNNFFNYGIKGGLVYKITGRHLIRLNGAYMTRAPFSRTAFISPRTRDEVVSNLKSEKIMSGDISYIVRYPKVKTRVTAFYTTIKDKTWSRSFYHEDLNTYVNYVMTGVDELYMGIEVGAETNLTSELIVLGAFSMGEYLYDSRPSASIVQDNSREVFDQNTIVYFENYKIGGMPQTAASIGLKYFSAKYWFASVNFNYFNDIYLSANPVRRTEDILDKFVATDPAVEDITTQTKLDGDYSITLSVGKSWKIKDKYNIRFNLNVNNVLNNTDFTTGGYEQLRFDRNDINKFPPKTGYMYGRTYFAMVSFSF